MEVGLLEDGDRVSKDGPFMVYVTRGGGTLNGVPVKDGDLVRGENLQFEPQLETQIIVVSEKSGLGLFSSHRLRGWAQF